MKMKKLLSLILIFMIYFVSSISVFAETVVYNTKTGKYHSPYCQWAKKCTVNCIKLEKKDAKARGGIPCKVCGG